MFIPAQPHWPLCYSLNKPSMFAPQDRCHVVLSTWHASSLSLLGLISHSFQSLLKCHLFRESFQDNLSKMTRHPTASITFNVLVSSLYHFWYLHSTFCCVLVCELLDPWNLSLLRWGTSLPCSLPPLSIWTAPGTLGTQLTSFK